MAGHDDALLEYAIWRPGGPDGLGDLHYARVQAYAPSLGGYFLALPQATGFLPESTGSFADGALLAVRTVRAALGGKGPRLALAETPAPGGAAPGLVARGLNPLQRLAAAHPGAPILTASAALLAILRGDFGDRVRLAADAFAPVEEAVDALAEPWAALPGGMRAGFFPTPALTAIDLDSAGASAGRAPKLYVQTGANLAALPALARQIRLRNLSGVILIDPAGLPARRRKALAPALAEALADDPVGPRLLGFTASGLAEIQRPRLAPPLHELLDSPLGQGLAALRRLGRLLPVPARGARPVLCATEPVVQALRADAGAIEAFTALHGLPPVLRVTQADPTPVCSLE